jgi:hypothetical protein
MNIKCKFNKNTDTNIFHFTDEKKENIIIPKNIINTTNNKNIYYEKINWNDFIIHFDRNMERIIKKCEDNNILIIINFSQKHKDILKKFNDYIKNLKNTENILQNITIINETNNNKDVLYYEKNNSNKDIFKKIINVFPSRGELFANDEDFFNKIKLDTSIPKTIDISKNIMYVFKQKGGEIKNIIIRVMDTKSKTKLLKDQWWFKWYFSIPHCGDIRLLQATGTCWLNSAINSLFMIESITNMIQENYQNNKNNNKEYEIKFSEFEKNKNLKNLINSLVYNLIINKTKAKYDDGNFLAHLASLIKCEYSKQSIENFDTKKCKHKNFGDGGDSYEAIKILLTNILGEKFVTFFDLHETLGGFDDYNLLYEKYKKTYEEFEKTINEYNSEIKKHHIDENKVYYLKNKYEELTKILKIYIEELDKINKNAQKINIKNYDIENLKLYENKNLNLNDILVFKGDFDTIKQNIKINNTNYKLQSSIIQLISKKINHVVSGIICNKEYYIYDSNNIFVKNDWYKGKNEIEKIFMDDNMKNVYGNKIIYDFIYVLIYVKF